MEKFDSISHFLETGDFQYRIFDMGRKVIRLSNQLFQKIEDQQELYPFPFQQKAWLALVFWKASKQDKAVIWFLQFPIDELGFLKQEARDLFLIDLLEQTGKNIQAKQQGEQTSDELSESPFAFKPRPDRLAIFHALANIQLNQMPSQYYQPTREYLKGKVGYEQWHFLGLQGIADVVARLELEDNGVLLSKAIKAMPEEPLLNFCYALENVKPPRLLTQALIAKLDNEIADQSEGALNVTLVAALVRALSASEPDTLRKSALSEVLGSQYGLEVEVLVAISGRAWKDLESLDLLLIFITNLAQLEQASFNAVLADLMMLPRMRGLVLTIMRDPERPQELGARLNEFMSLLQGG